MNSFDNLPTEIYYNFDLTNRSNETIYAVIDDTRISAIIDRASDYRLAIARFTLPVSSIPINHNTIKLFENWTVSISDGIGNSATEIVLVSDVNNGLVNTILNYQDITEAINLAYERALIALKILNPALTTIIHPEVRFKEDGFFTIVLEDTVIADNIDIWFSEKMWSYFLYPSVKTIPAVINDRKIKYVSNEINTIGGFIYYTQEYRTQTQLSDFRTIILETDSIPVVSELISGQGDITQRILTDFDPAQTTLGNTTRLSFFPQGPYRYYQLKGNNQIRRMDLRIFYLTDTGVKLPLPLIKDEFVNVKVLFEKIEKKSCCH